MKPVPRPCVSKAGLPNIMSSEEGRIQGGKNMKVGGADGVFGRGTEQALAQAPSHAVAKLKLASPELHRPRDGGGPCRRLWDPAGGHRGDKRRRPSRPGLLTAHKRIRHPESEFHRLRWRRPWA